MISYISKKYLCGLIILTIIATLAACKNIQTGAPDENITVDSLNTNTKTPESKTKEPQLLDSWLGDYIFTEYIEAGEFEEAGFKIKNVHGVIGVGWMVPNFDEEWESEESRKAILEVARMCENIPYVCSKIFIVATKE